jgi:hypothetical protein
VKIVTVLRSGGDYTLDHVERLRGQCAKWAPDAEFCALTDIDGTLRHDWPGWWCKMAAYEDVSEPFLLVDLDTTIVGPLDDILARRELTVLSDFYKPRQIQSSFMLVTPDAAAKAWAAWIADPERHMRECVTPQRWGDQGFLESVWGRDVARWQDVLPGACVSWKVDCRVAVGMKERGDGRIPNGARVVISHGKPRPWECGL